MIDCHRVPEPKKKRMLDNFQDFFGRLATGEYTMQKLNTVLYPVIRKSKDKIE